MYINFTKYKIITILSYKNFIVNILNNLSQIYSKNNKTNWHYKDMIIL